MSDAERTRPRRVGQGDHVVAPGECIASIAWATGHLPDTIWNHSANAEVKGERQDPHILLPGDRVTVPELRRKEESAGPGRRHRFRRLGVPIRIQIRVLECPDTPYELWVDSQSAKGKTDGDGCLDVRISPGARKAIFIVGEGEDRMRYELALGCVDPVREMSGVQQRLNNLGFKCGRDDGVCGGGTRAALRKFQENQGLKVTGEADDATRSKLVEVHGS